ncbi:MAG: hypothetical protein ACI4UB_06200 [Limosilactobacillus sp.]
MASGFILANQRGIAVSMDTMESSSQGEEYRGVNRIFPLGGQHKVVAVSRGIDKFMNIPVEILIQRFAHQLPTQPLDKLTDYPAAFMKFLNSDDAGLNDGWYINDSVYFVLDNLYDYYMQLFQQYGQQSSFEEVLDRAVVQLAQRWQPQSDADRILSLNKDDFIDQYGDQVGQTVNRWLNDLLGYAPNTNGRIFATQLQQPSQMSQQPRSIFSNEYPRIFDVIFHIMTTTLRGNYASIVFIGMGKDEYFGSLQLLNIYGYMHSVLARTNPVEMIDQTHEQIIDPVSTYTTQSIGAQLLQSGMAETSFQQIARILNENGMKQEDQKRLLGAIRRAMGNHNQGIRETITNLSPNELARMSRTMVEVNGFVSRFLLRNAGVGGDIETVIVTYQDGVIWLNRQQNIDYQLNPALLNHHDGEKD